MGDYVGVTLKELDYSTSVQSLAVTGAGFVGSYAWGPIEQPYTIANLDSYAILYGKPYAANKISYLTGASYLDYSDSLRVVRVAGANSKNATTKNYTYVKYTLENVLGDIIPGSTMTNASLATATVASYDATTGEVSVLGLTGLFFAEDSITFSNNATAKISEVVENAYFTVEVDEVSGAFTADETLTGSVSDATAKFVSLSGTTLTCQVITGLFVEDDVITGGTVEVPVTSTATSDSTLFDVYEDGILIKNEDQFESMVAPYKFIAKYAGECGNHIKISIANSSTFNSWDYRSLYDGAPEEGEIHLVVVDVDGTFYNSFAGNILSQYSYLSLTPNAKDEQGQDIYYRKVINNQDGYIYVGSLDIESTDYNTAIVLSGGVNTEPTDADLIAGYNKFSDQELESSLYVFGANYSTAVMNSIISMVDKRQDMLAIFSPSSLSLLQHSNINDTVTAVKAWGDSITMSNRVFLDSNWMYYYNPFDNEYVWIPMAGATTGINSRCDTVNNPWDSPMGFTRGTYLNVIRLAWQPDKQARIDIYARSINPIYVSNQAGVVLMGDRTHVIKQSYFRQMAARKTLILIERGAVSYLMYYLGENNNRQTRQLVTSNLSSWLRTLGSAGAFRLAQVVCNEQNNDQQTIDEQKMRVLIRLLLQSSINTIELQVAVVNNVASFTENVIQGRF